MIVVCEGCETRFRLDEAKLPATGARVRCSRCKHCFFLKPPESTEDDVLEELAREAAVQAASSPAAPTGDLPPPPDPPEIDSGARESDAVRPDEPLPEEREESDWEFNSALVETPPPAEAAPPPSRFAAPSESSVEPPPRAADVLDAFLGEEDSEPSEDSSSLDELGDPASWDLLNPGPPLATAPSLPEAQEAAPPERIEETVPVAVAETPHEPSAVSTPVAPVARHAAPRPQRVLHALGWVVTAGLLAAGMAGLVRGPSHEPPVLAPFPVVEGMTLEAVRGRVVENAAVGPILVVEGRVRNAQTRWRGIESGLVVRLLDSVGEPIPGAEAPAGRPLAESRLREQDPGDLRALHERDQRRFATRAVAPGLGVPFEAVFQGLPRAAAAFRVEPAPLPPPAPGATESPSPPSPLPSSG